VSTEASQHTAEIETLLFEMIKNGMQNMNDSPSVEVLLQRMKNMRKEVAKFRVVLSDVVKNGIRLTNVKKGSLKLHFELSTTKALITLWDLYRSGYLSKRLQEALISDDILKQWNVSFVKL